MSFSPPLNLKRVSKKKDSDYSKGMLRPHALSVDLTAVITRSKNGEPQVLTILNPLSLPNGGFSPEKHRTLELGLRTWVKEQTGQDLDYVEQLYTFGNWHRNPEHIRTGQRNVTVGYHALVPYTRELSLEGTAWTGWYHFFPWEDFREGAPAILQDIIEPALTSWICEADHQEERRDRERRVALNFGNFQSWDRERSVFRYELLYEAGLVEEAHRDWDDWADDAEYQLPISSKKITDREYRENSKYLGKAMAGDYRRMLASTIARLRGKIKYRPIVFELLPEEFTLFSLQKVIEGISGQPLHKQNFRRDLLKGKILEETGNRDSSGPGRPAALYRFRKEMVAEAGIFGVKLPVKR